MYENQGFPEIYSINSCNNEIANVSPSDSEWCQNEVMEGFGYVQDESEKVKIEVTNNTSQGQKVKEPDKSNLPRVAAMSPPDELPGFQAIDGSMLNCVVQA